ncbi:MAG: hypothetical protein M3R70_05830 [Actinomycetota bacterium]|nr:hypothetical protein [Actinomycetota bacterium]
MKLIRAVAGFFWRPLSFRGALVAWVLITLPVLLVAVFLAAHTYNDRKVTDCAATAETIGLSGSGVKWHWWPPGLKCTYGR